MIICPYEGTFATTGATTSLADKGTLKLNISSWQWPDYYGEKSGSENWVPFVANVPS